MSRTVTLSQLRDDVSTQADIVGIVSSSERHTPTMLNRYINQSIHRFRERLAAEGAPRYLTSTTGTLTAGTTSPYPFSLLDLSSVTPGIVKIYGVDITVNSSIQTLDGVSFAQRAAYGSQPGTPAAWAQYDTTKIVILPAPSSAYAYVVWYLPVFTDLVSDTDSWDGVAGWEQWITWDVVSRVIIRDNTSNAYAMVVGYRDEIFRDILKGAREPNSTASRATASDKFGRRIYGTANAYERRVPPLR